MKSERIQILLTTITLLIISMSCSFNKSNPQVAEAAGVIGRVLPEYTDQFILKLVEKEGDKDVFEIEPLNRKIVIRGSSGIALCSGFNYYLKNYCNAIYC